MASASASEKPGRSSSHWSRHEVKEVVLSISLVPDMCFRYWIFVKISKWNSLLLIATSRAQLRNQEKRFKTENVVNSVKCGGKTEGRILIIVSYFDNWNFSENFTGVGFKTECSRIRHEQQEERYSTNDSLKIGYKWKKNERARGIHRIQAGVLF